MSTIEQQQIAVLKREVKQLEAKVEFLYQHLGATFVEPLLPTDDADIVNALRQGNEMEAIKVYRAKNNAGLAEAKTMVDEIRSRLGL